MTPVTEILTPARASETRLIAGVCFAHLVSHYYMVLLAPLFLFIRADFGVTYTQLGLALTAFNVVSAVLQTPVGFLVDRIGARVNLIGGLLLGAAAVAAAGLIDSFWVFIAMYAVLGLANTVYHPADYALLSEHVAPARLTQVFSFHTCAGMIGSAVRCEAVHAEHGRMAQRLLCAAALGRAAPSPRPAGEPQHGATQRRARGRSSADGLKPLLSHNLLNQSSSCCRWSAAQANIWSWAGALMGRRQRRRHSAHRPARHERRRRAIRQLRSTRTTLPRRHRPAGDRGVSRSSLRRSGRVLAGAGDLQSGFAGGMTMPSRDMIVRSATPPGSFGKVFGFVTTGLHIGGMVSPVIFGNSSTGHPRGVFLYIAACALPPSSRAASACLAGAFRTNPPVL
jgi:hypothetical protein